MDDSKNNAWGYDEPSAEWLASLREFDVSTAIVELNAFWLAKWQADAYSINCGDCEFYACCLAYIFDGQEYWGDELLTEAECEDDVTRERYEYHCICKIGDRFYDSEHPFGVSDFREISAFSGDYR